SRRTYPRAAERGFRRRERSPGPTAGQCSSDAVSARRARAGLAAPEAFPGTAVPRLLDPLPFAPERGPLAPFAALGGRTGPGRAAGAAAGPGRFRRGTD